MNVQHAQYFGLTRIFHTEWSRGAANPDAGTTGGQGDRGGDCPGFKGAALKGRDERERASQRR